MVNCEINVLHQDDADVEELHLAQAREAEKGQIHLLLGDSIPYQMQDRLETSPHDILLNRVSRETPGPNWPSVRLTKSLLGRKRLNCSDVRSETVSFG